VGFTLIPKRLIRTVPEHPSDEQNRLWKIACDLHPTWEHVDRRDPNDPELFPLTNHLWATCDSGSQKSDLIRAEELFSRGGIYVDSDVECYRPFNPFLGLDGFAGFEDKDHICTAIMGFRPGHPAVEILLHQGIKKHAEGAWPASIGVASVVFPPRNDMLLLPPGTLFPTHYHDRWNDRMPSSEQIRKEQPWAYCNHLWDGSWLKK
jgi:mannosyltransferase OCH1-like enzyme